MDRVAIFIDGPNLKSKIDVIKLVERLAGGRHIVGSYYYCSEPEPRLDTLTARPELASQFKLRIDAIGRAKKYGAEGVDLKLSVDMVSLGYEDHYDVALLVSGDAGYRFALQRVQALNKEIELAAWKTSLGGELLDLVPDFLPIESIRPEIVLRRVGA